MDDIPPAWIRKQREPKPIPPAPPEWAEHKQKAWIWKLQQGEGAYNSTRTGGRPIMGEDEVWPICGACKNALTFMLQCNLDTLPDEMRGHGSGMLRFFTCMHADCVGMGGWEPFSPQHHLNVLHGYGHTQNPPKGTFVIRPEFLSGVIEVEDFPHWPEQESLGLPESENDIQAQPGHKFAGWPCWIQGPERPKCPDCKDVMEPFIQLDNDWNPAFNFGGGIGHISQCKTHIDNFAFGWAC